MRVVTASVLCLLAASASPAQQVGSDWRESILKAVLPHFKLTKATADRSSIVTAGTVVVLKKDNLALFSVATRVPPGNSYVNGAIKQSFFAGAFLRANDGSARSFVAGEKLWLTKVQFEPKNDGIVLEFLSDPFNDARYWGTLKFGFAKGSPPPGPDEFVTLLGQVLKPDDAPPSAVEAPTTPTPAPPPPPPPPPAETLAPIPPPPPPPDQPAAPPPTVAVGMTKDQVLAIMGQPKKIATLSPTKQIYLYADFKITLTAGKVSNIE